MQHIREDDVICPWEDGDGVLIFKDHNFIPLDSTLRQELIRQFHDGAHEGFQKSFQGVRANFFWQKMREDIKEFIVSVKFDKDTR